MMRTLLCTLVLLAGLTIAPAFADDPAPTTVNYTTVGGATDRYNDNTSNAPEPTTSNYTTVVATYDDSPDHGLSSDNVGSANNGTPARGSESSTVDHSANMTDRSTNTTTYGDRFNLIPMDDRTH